MAFVEENKNGVVYMKSTLIPARHAFTTRLGGVSRGAFKSLNLGASRGDLNEHVAENYDILCRALDLPRDRLVFTHQIHECSVRRVTGADAHTLFTDVPYDADGLVTGEKNLALLAFTADCVPILLCEEDGRAIAAVHAGWRGTAGCIAEKAVEKLRREYGVEPKKLRAAIGPCIGKCCFEVGVEVVDAMFDAIGGSAEKYVSPKTGFDGKFTVDLRGVNAHILQMTGVRAENIDISSECTMCLHEKYWSHRYTNGIRGVQAAVIIL